ncbi:M16 family metallopeptidase [Virgisporangium aurantiacum]|uniref:Peptidase M16 n=1 Tax=Virgisporangium aurantiacum TaxID=175570 RepID=A0A8J4E214_9ACTN|nr:insulinase family protein [Virgisporangium aurantiacum]GIJ58496.1 peptidase M16 [Virgisporangium aurantiacum]
MIVDRTLANGLRVLALRPGTGPLVEVRLHVPAPAVTRRQIAAQALLAACLTARHTTGRTGSASAAGAAAEFRAWSDYRRVGMSGSCAVGGPEAVLRLVADAVTGLSATETDYATERGQLVTRLRLGLAHPDAPVRLALWRQLFGDHPIGLQLPDVDEVLALDADDVARHGAAALRPDGATLVIVGPTDPDRSVRLAGDLLGGWPPGPPRPAVPALSGIPEGDVRPFARPGAGRAQIRLRAAALPQDDLRYPALMVASNVFGSGTSSRLVRELREDKGYVYGVACFFDPVPGSTLVALEADTATGTALPAVGALAAELRRLFDSPPTVAEVDAARRRAVGAAVTSLASRAALASSLAELAAAGIDPPWLFGFADRLREVTHDAVLDATAHFAPHRFSGLVAGDLPADTHLEMA